MLQLESRFLDGKWHPFPSQCDAGITEDVAAVCSDHPSTRDLSNERSLKDQAACGCKTFNLMNFISNRCGEALNTVIVQCTHHQQ